MIALWFALLSCLCAAESSCHKRCFLPGSGRLKLCLERSGDPDLCSKANATEGCCASLPQDANFDCSCDQHCHGFGDCCPDISAQCGVVIPEPTLASRHLLQAKPTRSPTQRPSKLPTKAPTIKSPTNFPSRIPTKFPTVRSTRSPTLAPTRRIPTNKPTRFPTRFPTPRSPPTPLVPTSKIPTTNFPTKIPTSTPTRPSTLIPTTKRPSTGIPTTSPTLIRPCEQYGNSCQLCTTHLRDSSDPTSTCYWVRTAPVLLNFPNGTLKPRNQQMRVWSRCCSEPDCGLRRTVYVGASRVATAVWPLVTQDPSDCGCAKYNMLQLRPYDSYYAYLNQSGNGTSMCLACNGQYDATSGTALPTSNPTVFADTLRPTGSPTPLSFRATCVYTAAGCQSTNNRTASVVPCGV